MGETQKKQITVFEVSYEICNKYGGIYTVVTSKMARMMESIQNYIAIGPYYEKNAMLEFMEEKAAANFKKAFSNLNRKYGIKCRMGKWTIRGQRILEVTPQTILIDPAGYRKRINDIKSELWEFAGVDSLNSDWWYDEPLPFAKASGLLIEELVKTKAVEGKVVAHFHEFLTGAGLLHLKKNKSPVKTVFTAHGTMLGRAIAGTGKEDIHSMIKNGIAEKRVLPDDKAREYNVLAKHTLERASAQKSDIFTTVSDVLGMECEFLFGRKPDINLYNGLDMLKFPIMEDLSDLHIRYRDCIRDFLSAYFSPYYPIDVENTILLFISGRFEFHNKGIDMFLDALGNLNKRLKKEGSRKTVIAFMWIPCHVHGRRSDVMDNMVIFEGLNELVAEESRRISRKIVSNFIQRKRISGASVMDKGFLGELKKAALSLQKEGQNPPITPFIVDENDVTRHIQKNGLLNRKDDRVKIIYYPTYLSSTDGLIGLNYYDAIIGCNVGVFPSYYEPWGYTPLEAAALGCQSITTDYAGYGKFIKNHLGKNDCSIIVIPRENRPYDESVRFLEDSMYRIYRMDKRERVQFKIMAKQLSKKADWSELIGNYLKSYDMALKK